ncbi:MAG: acyl carrier protein [Planctomycetes bacterium]|nr:acyl carrier protein [Planctomycetota bacterium]
MIGPPMIGPDDRHPPSISGRVRGLLADVAGVDADGVVPEARFDDLGVDSVTAAALLGRLEEAFDVTITPEDALHLTTVGAVVRYVSRHARCDR